MGVHVAELRLAIDIEINKILEKPALEVFDKKLIMVLCAAKQYLDGKQDVRLGPLQDSAMKLDEMPSVGVHLFGKRDERLIEAFEAPLAGNAEALVSNLHFLTGAAIVGEKFCECMAVQEKKEDEWIKQRIQDSDRGVPRIYVNRTLPAKWYARELYDLEQQRQHGSLRVAITKNVCVKAREALVDCLKDRQPPPGTHEIDALVRGEVAQAAKELGLQLGEGRGLP